MIDYVGLVVDTEYAMNSFKLLTFCPQSCVWCSCRSSTWDHATVFRSSSLACSSAVPNDELPENVNLNNEHACPFNLMKPPYEISKDVNIRRVATYINEAIQYLSMMHEQLFRLQALHLNYSRSKTHLVRVRQLELPPVPRPVDVRLARFVRQKFKKELPQLNRPTAVIRREKGARQEGIRRSVALWK